MTKSDIEQTIDAADRVLVQMAKRRSQIESDAALADPLVAVSARATQEA